jgi:formylglycine-generating enzyme required for sulfatase activity
VSVVAPDFVVIAASDALLDDPLRTIHVNIFGIARAPVSNRDYAAFVASTAHPAPRRLDADARGAHPVEGVSMTGR